jgi:hypothetical protein
LIAANVFCLNGRANIDVGNKQLNLSMRILMWIIAAQLLSISLYSNITTTRGGDIWVQEYSPGFFRLKGMLLLTDPPTVFDSVRIDWGDALMQKVCLYGYAATTTPQGTRVSFDLTHIYSPGTYNLLLTCGKRVPWITNMDNSGDSDFTLLSSFICDPNLSMNSLPLGDTLNYEVELNAGTMNVIPHTAVDFEGDSVRFYRLTPLVTTNYQQPESVGGGTFTYTSGSGNFSWDPQVPGLYSVLFGIYEYRQFQNGNWVMYGVHTREILLDVGSVSAVPELQTSEMHIFPNPSSGYITVQGLQANDVVVVYDALGVCVLKQTSESESTRMDLSQLAPGVYWLMIESDDLRFGLRSKQIVVAE